VAAVAFLGWTQGKTGTVASGIAFVVAALALVGGLLAVMRVREGWAFLGTFVAIAAGVAGLFLGLFPDVMPTSLADGVSLTTTNASATDYTLKIMTVTAVIFTPLVLAYQAWSYWVFRKRISVHHIPTAQVVTSGQT
jgi:cytochrome d ubiquinol oxidase subunit II